MATIVCQQSSQPCLESQLVEARTTTLILKLSSFASNEPAQSQKSHYGGAVDQIAAEKGGWSFLQSLSDHYAGGAAAQYVHPLCKRASATILSERSLALCTENLGNETGTTDTTADCGAPEPAIAGIRERVSRRRSARAAERSFPPPLTTRSGHEALQVKPRREGGRLIMTAVKAPVRLSSCFRAERSDGRLRLCLLDSSAPALSSDEDMERENFENDIKEEEDKEEGEGEGEEEEAIGVAEEEEDQGRGENEKKMMERGRIEKFARARGGRCKEGDQYIVENKAHMLKPFWVAT